MARAPALAACAAAARSGTAVTAGPTVTGSHWHGRGGPPAVAVWAHLVARNRLQYLSLKYESGSARLISLWLRSCHYPRQCPLGPVTAPGLDLHWAGSSCQIETCHSKRCDEIDATQIQFFIATMKLKLRVARVLKSNPNGLVILALLHLFSDVAADYSIKILQQPQYGYARQRLLVQPAIYVEGDARIVQAYAGNYSANFFGNNIIEVVSGFANFTDLGFRIPGEFIITFNADGIGNVYSNPFVVQVLHI